MSITRHNAAIMKNNITRNLHTAASQSAKIALLHIERAGVAQDKLKELKKLAKDGTISINELGSHAKKIKSNLDKSENSVIALLDSTGALARGIKMKQDNALNLLDDSASVLIAQAYKTSSKADKAEALQDVKVLAALNKAGSYLSGMNEDSLNAAVNSHFASDEVIGPMQSQLADDNGVLSAISKDITGAEFITFSQSLDLAISEGSAIEAAINTDL